MPSRITLSDIARKTQLSVATVSRALRGKSEIRGATIKKVRAAADALGYVPDPALSALVEHRRGLRAARFLETLALISPEFSWAKSRMLPRRMALIQAMRERAEELGYKLDFFHLERDPVRVGELVRMFYRRRIRGLIVLPSDPPAESLPLPWERFAAVRVFRPPLDARLPSVDADLYQGVHLIRNYLEKQRLRIPGLVLPKSVVPYARDIWSKYMAMIASESGAIRPVTPFICTDWPERQPDRSALIEWFDRLQPDVVVAMDCAATASVLAGRPGRNGVAPAFIDLDIDLEHRVQGDPPGLLQSRTAIGRSTIDHLHRLLVTNQLGLPEHPTTVKTAFRWVE